MKSVFKVTRKSHPVLLTDTQRCAALKYRIKFSGDNVPAYKDRYQFYYDKIAKFNIAYVTDLPSARYGDEVRCTNVNICIPIRKRAAGEIYIPVISSSDPMVVYAPIEIWAPNTLGEKDYDVCLLLQTQIDNTISVESFVRGLELYIYSNKHETKANYGLEVYDEKGDTVLTSGAQYLRVIDVYHKEYPIGPYTDSGVLASVTYDTSKLGIAATLTVSGQGILIAGNLIETWVRAIDPRKVITSRAYSTTQYIAVDLDAHSHFPVTVDPAEI